jgi:flavin reductase (DIM6/NTAB) family NADH-FMN oxidoreductase RutF
MISTGSGQFDAALLRQAYGLFPSGVTAFCALVGDQPIGMTASSFTSVSLDPALVSLCVAHTSTTWPALSRVERLGISVLSSAQGVVARQLAERSYDRFAGIDWHAAPSGAVFLPGAALWLECERHQEVAAGDHVIVILRIVGLAIDPEPAPIVFHRSGFYELARNTRT